MYWIWANTRYNYQNEYLIPYIASILNYRFLDHICFNDNTIAPIFLPALVIYFFRRNMLQMLLFMMAFLLNSLSKKVEILCAFWAAVLIGDKVL